jgi:hypothetical protein
VAANELTAKTSVSTRTTILESLDPLNMNTFTALILQFTCRDTHDVIGHSPHRFRPGNHPDITRAAPQFTT